MKLRLVNAPAKQARDITKQLRQHGDRDLKLVLFSLQKYIRVRFRVPYPFFNFLCALNIIVTVQEEQFAREFIVHDGLIELVEVIATTNGNTLAVSAEHLTGQSDSLTST